jgi:polyisoprenoid-binding protein YceI
MKKLLLFVSAFSLATFGTQAAVETYKIDSSHTSIGFKIRHFVTPVPGSLTVSQGTIIVDRDDLTKSSVEVTIGVASINTSNERRDAHLKNPDFFEVEKYPTATFKSKSWKKTGTDTFDVTGDLTIKDTTKEVVLQVTSLGFVPGNRPGSMISGWEATTKINRRDWGVGGPAGLAKVLGDEVTISISVEAGLQKPA